MKQYSFLILMLALILNSCTTETKKTFSTGGQLRKYVQVRYEAKEVNSTIGTRYKNGKKETYFEIGVSKSKIIDKAKAESEQFASDIALRLYSSLGKAEQKKYDFFVVKIEKNNRVTEFQYKNKTMQEVKDNLIWLEGTFMELIDEKEYIVARWRFDLQLVDTTGMDLEALYEPLEEKLGKLKSRELQGFLIGETKINGKKYRVMKAIYLSFYGKHYTLSHYTLMINDSEQKMLRIDIV